MEDRKPFLSALLKAGVESVELRTVRAAADPKQVLEAARFLWGMGFQITVHGEVKSLQTAVFDVFTPLEMLLGELHGKKLNVTVHPITGDNVAMLCSLSDHITMRGLPVTIALENNRLLPDKTEGDSAALVEQAVTEANRDNVGICFDMGHYQYYLQKNHPEDLGRLPSPAFFKRVIHTHIHGLCGSHTHYPLGLYPLPLRRFTEPFCQGFHGVYNLELTFSRFAESHDPKTALLTSIKTLQDELPLIVKEYDDARRSFDDWFTSALKVEEAGKGLHFGLIHSSSYLFNSDGYFWGMDLAFREAWNLAETPARAAQLLKNLKLMVITHGHRDHFEERTVKCLAHLPTVWVIPEFLAEKALSLGISREKMLIAKAGEALQVGPLTLLPFTGRHFRPGTGQGVEELGYIVTADGLPSLAFPADVRDFSLDDMPVAGEADYCFGHVWLGDRQALEPSHTLAQNLAAYELYFSRKTILLTHLHELGRTEDNMWRECHAEEVKKAILDLSCDTNVLIPKRGEILSLE